MRTSWSITGSVVLLVLLVLSWVGSAAQRGAPPQNVEDAFKNIKVLTGTPADQLFLTMQFFEASLGWAASSVTAVLVTRTRHANQKLAKWSPWSARSTESASMAPAWSRATRVTAAAHGHLEHRRRPPPVFRGGLLTASTARRTRCRCRARPPADVLRK